MMSELSYLEEILTENINNFGESILTNKYLLELIQASSKRSEEDAERLEQSMPDPSD